MIKTSIAFMLGCILLLQLNTLADPRWFLMLIPSMLMLRYKKTRFIAIVFLALLWTLFRATLVINDRLNSELEGQDIMVTGVVSSIVQHNSLRLRFEFKPDPVFNDRLPDKLLLSWYRPFDPELKPGQQWQLSLRLKKNHGLANPASFDYESWLMQQGIGATGYIRKHSDNHRIQSAPFYSINALRQSLLTIQASHLNNSDYLGLIQGLTSGIRNNISADQWQTLRASGTAHLLAISGLHIGLAAAIGFFIFRSLWSLRAANLLVLPANEFAAIGGFLLALFYTALAGFAIPSQRALIMIATVMISLLIRRPVAPSSLLALSLLLILIIDPFAVLSAGFYLSFAAVAIILIISQNRFPSPRLQWLKIHTLLAFGLTPLLLLFFWQSSVIAPIANIIAIPFISFIIVPLLLLSSFLLLVSESLALSLLTLVDYLLSLFWPILDFLASLPWAQWSITPLPLYYYFSIGLATLILLLPRALPAKSLAIIGFAPLLFFSPARPDHNEFWFTLLDVGQGLSAVVQTHSHTLVFDTGPRFSDSFNTGTAIVKPFLHQQGIKRIDTLIISHGDNDHIGGALPLIDAITVDKILSSVPGKLPNAQGCYAGQSWLWDGILFELLHPDKDQRGSDNDLSCVLKVSNHSGSVLLTGDIEQKAESQLVRNYATKLQSTVLIAPHHGSKTSSSDAFIDVVSPDIVLFPSGYRNRFNFPHPIVSSRYQQRHIRSFNSSITGAITIKFTAQGVSEPSLWRQTEKKIWH